MTEINDSKLENLDFEYQEIDDENQEASRGGAGFLSFLPMILGGLLGGSSPRATMTPYAGMPMQPTPFGGGGLLGGLIGRLFGGLF